MSKSRIRIQRYDKQNLVFTKLKLLCYSFEKNQQHFLFLLQINGETDKFGDIDIVGVICIAVASAVFVLAIIVSTVYAIKWRSNAAKESQNTRDRRALRSHHSLADVQQETHEYAVDNK